MNDRDERELQAILRALDTEDPQAESRTDAEDRELAELAGLLAYASDPSPAPPVTALFERLGLREPAAGPRASGDRPSVPAWTRWALAAAVLLLIGVAGLAAALYQRLERQAERLADLERRFGWFEQATSDAELAALQSAVRFLSSPGMMACGLEPMSEDQPEARGTVYMSPGAGRWMLTVDNLEPAPEGQLYRIWFVTDAGPVNGGSFRVEQGRGRVEVGAEQLPPGLRAVSITVEPAAAQDWPTGQQVLFGDEAREIL